MSKVYQYGTLAMLAEGLLGGTLPLEKLLAHGDFGIGTGSGLDGEFMILDGQTYQAKADGTVNQIDTALIPFGNVHHASFNNQQPVKNVTSTTISAQLAQFTTYQNTMTALKLHGQFSRVKTRAVSKQVEPYPTLEETAKQQQVFTAKNISGTVMGYFTPELLQGAGVGGMHLHFLSDDHQMGGHLLDFDLVRGTLAWEILNGLELELPVQDAQFMQHTPTDLDEINNSIKRSE